MVELEEVEDPELEAPQPGPSSIDDDENSDDYSDTDSSISTSSLPPSLPSETISERIYALRDMLSPGTRRRISGTTAQITGLVKNGAWWGGRGLYVLTASVLMVGVPWAMAFVEEQQIMEMERTERAREVTGEILTPGAATSGRAPL